MPSGELPCLDILGDDALLHILKHLATDVQDLLRFSRTSQRYHSAVFEAEDVWKQAYEATFGASSTAPSGTAAPTTTWMDLFKTRAQEDARRRRQKVAASRLKAASSVQTLGQEVFRLAQSLQTEERLSKSLQEELATIRKATRAAEVQAATATYWAPVAVTRAQGSFVVQVPQDAETRCQTLQEKIAVGTLECNKLRNMLAARRKALQLAKSKYQALLP